MKPKLLLTIAVLLSVILNLRAVAADPADEKTGEKTPGKATPKSDLQVLISKVQGKLKGGTATEKDLADELKEFDALLDKYKDQKNDDVARILLMKGMLYLQVLDDSDKGTVLLKRVKAEFPETESAKNVDKILEQVAAQSKSKLIQKELTVGKKFPDFEEKDLQGNPLSIANYKGKVVLVDFWATWCGPCIRELPNVLKAYEKHPPNRFEIVGISLDQDKTKLANFIESKGMKWPQYFDGKGWGNKLAGKYGVNSIPATYLLDGEGKIIAKNLRGDDLEETVAKSLTK
jgi:thiol-disulfide isomerase/thioredoxin